MERWKRLRLVGLLVVAVSGVGVLAGASGAAPSGGCVTSAGQTTCTFNYTGAAESWSVPAGVTSAQFDVYGAAGGSYADGDPEVPGGSGGKGGRVHATVALTPGTTVHLRVGGKGDDGLRVESQSATVTAAGGFNGGGTNTSTCSNPAGECIWHMGGAGGGASDVRSSGDGLADRLLVAGGGGGSGIGGVGETSAGDGGDSATDAPSVSMTFGSGPCSGGAAGTLVGPGAAGSGTNCVSGSAGDGASGGGYSDEVGAGGGGFFGGGAGAMEQNGFGGSGGGGGSDYPDPASPPAGISAVTVTNGVQSGNGLITVTYTAPPNASDQLTALFNSVKNTKPGKALGDKVKQIQAYAAANNNAGACAGLSSFISLVNAQKGKKLNNFQVADFVAQANAIKTTLGC